MLVRTAPRTAVSCLVRRTPAGCHRDDHGPDGGLAAGTAGAAAVSRAAWRLDQAERERAWALASARAEGVSIRKLAAAEALSPARVHQITAAADLDELDVALAG